MVAVSGVVDGGTIVVAPAVDALNKVRLIGVDASEDQGLPHGRQPCGEEHHDVLEGKWTALELDVEKTDRYGRLLVYGGLSDRKEVNEVLLEMRYMEHVEETRRGSGQGIAGPDNAGIDNDPTSVAKPDVEMPTTLRVAF